MNLSKVHQEILRVDKSSGQLRLLLLLAGMFITWSLFALISSFYQPLPSPWGQWFNHSAASTSLAADLWAEISSHYFSLYTLSFTALSFYGLIGAFSFAKRYLVEIGRFSSEHSASQYLTRCIFALPTPPVLSIPNDGENFIGMLGPAIIMSRSDIVYLVQTENGAVRVVMPNEECEQNWVINPTEQLLAMIPLGLSKVCLEFKGICADARNYSIKDMQLTYGLGETLGSDLNHLHALASSLGTKDWETIAIRTLECGMRQILGQFSTSQIAHAWKTLGKEKSSTPAGTASSSHGIRSHASRHPAGTCMRSRSSAPRWARGRRHNPRAEFRSNLSKPTDLSAQTEFMRDIQLQLNEHVNAAFPMQILNIEIVRPGELAINENLIA